MKHKLTTLLLIAGLLGMVPFSVAQAKSKSQADKLWQEKSYRLAVEQYDQLLKKSDQLGSDERRELLFKSADAAWRTKENRRYEDAVKRLEELVESDTQDRWWAEANESLAEHLMMVNRWQHKEKVVRYLQSARGFWAGSKDIDQARPRFIRATFVLGDFISQNWGWGYRGIQPLAVERNRVIPDEPGNLGLHTIYEELLKVTKSDEDRAKVYFSLGMSYYHQYHDQKKKQITEKYFNKVIKEYSTSEWVDDAYFYLAQYYQQQNKLDEALDAYRALQAKFKRGESKWVNNATNQIKSITQPQLNLGVSYTFLPGSEIQFNIGWKNIKNASLSIYKVDLQQELRFNPGKRLNDHHYGVNNYQEIVNRLVNTNRYQRLPQVLSVPLRLKNEGKYKWYSENKGLAEWRMSSKEEELDPFKGVLEPGAYLAMIVANGVKAQELILVTDVGVVTKTGGHSGLIYVFDSQTGKPRAEANVKYQYKYINNKGNWSWEQGASLTNAEGLVKIPFKTSARNKYNNQHELFTVVTDGAMQAFSQGRNYSYHNNRQWWLYAYSDRPAYRPNEKVSFKITVRGYDDSTFNTPSQKPVQARIFDARGTKVFEKDYVLNDFGSFADELSLDEKATLGQYRVELYSDNWGTHLGSSPLFRLEEYKLPEFIVNVKPKPNSDGQTIYQLGDEVQVELDASYYFGGAVAEADVEYLVYQKPYHHYYRPPHKYPWYYEDRMMHRGFNHYNSGTLLKKESIKTDKEGKAYFSFETPESSGQDLEYRIEVRVVDQSRREISSTSTIKVTKNSFYAYLTPKHYLYRPGDQAQVDIKTLTANSEPVSVDGKVSVYRSWWRDEVVAHGRVTKPGQYDENELFTKFVKTNEKGDTEFKFEPERDGYYVVKFTGFDNKGNEVTSQTNVYVCAKDSTNIGYRYGGIQIIAEKDTYSIGETAKVMIVNDRPGAWVLFSQEADEIFGHQLHNMEGTVKLLEFEVKDTFTPNIFLHALTVENYQLKMAQIPLIVPPDQKFLNIKVISDKATYRPQEEGLFDIEVTDYQGEPVMGEVSLGLVDASVYYIQEEYVQDIRQFFYGTKRQLSVQTNSSFYYKQYQKFVRAEDSSLVTEDVLKMMAKQARQAKDQELSDDKRTDVGYAKNDFGRQNVALQAASGMAMDAVAESVSAPMAARSRGGFQLSKAKKMVRKESFADNDMMESEERKANEGGAGSGEDLKSPKVRQDFRSTAYWQPTIVTNKEGKAQIRVKFPDSLTTWRATARTISKQTAVGNITHETKTNKDVIIRLQAPRFFTERDEVVLSANVHNYTDEPQKIKVLIDAQGLNVVDEAEVWVDIDAQGERRVDWKAQALEQGTAKITVSAQATQDADAMVKSYPVIPHGIEKFIAESLVVKSHQPGTSEQSFILDLPSERIEESTSLQIKLSPSIAATMLDALPYLADFPYGCVEQTMSRFLPAVIVKKTLKDLGLSDRDVNNYINNVLIPREDPNHPDRKENTTVEKLDEMTTAGLDRLYDFQHADGGWGWWKKGNSDRFMTAYVVWGMSLAKQAGIEVRNDVLTNGVRYLQKELVEVEDQPDMLAWLLHALGSAQSKSKFETKQIARLWEMRDELNPYTRALFALSQHYRGQNDQAETLARNLANGMIEDKDNKTVHWGESGIYYRFSNGGVEATAFVIKALSNIDPESKLIEPAVKWLALNRRGARWKNTRDTAICILGLADYLRTTSELTPDFDFKVILNGKVIREEHIDRSNVFTFDRNIELPNEALQDGANTVEVKFDGAGALYASGYLKYFTLEENITPAGNEVFVERKYFIEDTAETLLKGYDTEWRPLENGAEVTSGDRIRVEITLEAKNNYEYLIVEDYKPAGLEAVQIKSGSGYAKMLDHKGKPSGQTTWIYQEFRDQKGAFFIDKLKQGKHLLTYELRAEVPGTFHAMPNQTHAMYVPEIRANSSEMIISVNDRE